MINLRILKQYDINSLDKPTVAIITEFARNQPNASYRNRIMHVIVVTGLFCDITATPLSIVQLNNPDYIEHFMKGLVGFTLTEIDTRFTNKCLIVRECLKVIAHLCELSNLTLRPLKISKAKITSDMQDAIQYYKDIFEASKERMYFYHGWTVKDSNGVKHNIDLTQCYINYGQEFTIRLHAAFTEYARCETFYSLKQSCIAFANLVRTIVTIYGDYVTFTQAMSAGNCHTSIAGVYNMQLLQAKMNGLCLKSFHHRWKVTVLVFKSVFIQQKLVPFPLVELMTPVYKASGKQVTARSKVKYDDQGNAFNSKLITKVPLSYTDDMAKEVIFMAIKADIKHVVWHCRQLVEETICRYEKFHELATQGQVKKVSRKFKSSLGNPVAMTITANVCATFANYGWQFPVKKGSYITFLGHEGRSILLNELVSIPTKSLLFPFIFLLIEQHPVITESWLFHWQLYDKQGRLHGFKQVQKQWVIVSEKSRKGSRLAQQTIVLNSVSKLLVEQILKLTAQAREYLKSIENDDYRAMLIATQGVATVPARITKFRIVLDSKIGNALAQSSPYVVEEKAPAIAAALTCASMRASCGVRVYLETQSVHAMAEALGHERYRPALITHYLPAPLWQFFVNRWVRLFQNAIVYEAMKDSEYLFCSLDIGPTELDVFLKNHSLGELPHHIQVGKQKAKDLANDDISKPFDKAVFMMSTALIQVFFAIVEMIDKVNDKQQLTAIACHWDETARFILAHLGRAFSEGKEATIMLDNDLKAMYQLAKANPLAPTMLAGAILC